MLDPPLGMFCLDEPSIFFAGIHFCSIFVTGKLHNYLRFPRPHFLTNR